MIRLDDPRVMQSRSRYRLPFMLAGLYKRYCDARETRDRYAYGLAFAEGVFRFFAYVNIANVIAVRGESEETSGYLQSLPHGAIGRFIHINQWACRVLSSSSNQFFCPELEVQLMSRAWGRVQAELTQTRNRYAHGVLVVSDTDKLSELESHITEIIKSIQWLSDYRLGVFTDGKYHRRSKTYQGYWRLSAGLEEDAEPLRVELRGNPPPWEQVVLLNPACDQALSLSPLIYRSNQHGVSQYFWLHKISNNKDQFVYSHPHLTEITVKAQPTFDQEKITPTIYLESYQTLHCIDHLQLSLETVKAIQSPHDLGGLEQTYEIVRQVGEGGMGVVYEVYHKVYESRLALKVLRDEASQRKIDLDRFRREAKLLHTLKHPSIVEMYTVGQERGTYYIEMEFIEGMSLKSYLSEKPRPSLKLVLTWLVEILQAVNYIHACNVIHRDLKPSNIMILGDHIKLIDFGIAKLTSSDLTRSGTLSNLGTELFMAPEQWNHQATHLSDLYACGLLLGSMLGAPPRIPNRPPDLLDPELPEPLQAIYRKAISFKEAHRFQSAAEFLRALADAGLVSASEIHTDIHTDTHPEIYPEIHTQTYTEAHTLQAPRGTHRSASGGAPAEVKPVETQRETNTSSRLIIGLLLLILIALTTIIVMMSSLEDSKNKSMSKVSSSDIRFIEPPIDPSTEQLTEPPTKQLTEPPTKQLTESPLSRASQSIEKRTEKSQEKSQEESQEKSQERPQEHGTYEFLKQPVEQTTHPITQPSARSRRNLTETTTLSHIAVTWRHIQGARFMMGTDHGRPEERPRHEVKVSSFEMMSGEVTTSQYRQCAQQGACRYSSPESARALRELCSLNLSDHEDLPMTCIMPSEAIEFCQWVGGRLPTEEEWEFAARGGSPGAQYPWGVREPSAKECTHATVAFGVSPTSGMKANRRGCGLNRTTPPCTYPLGMSPQGICDLSGNVWEITASHFRRDYRSAHDVNLYTTRGGGFWSNIKQVKSFRRSKIEVGTSAMDVGFRCVRSPQDRAQ